MASILIVTSASTGAAVDSNQYVHFAGALTGAGHSVTRASPSTPESYVAAWGDGYDLVVLMQAPINSFWADKWAAGVPLMIGPSTTGTSGNTTGYALTLQLWENNFQYNNNGVYGASNVLDALAAHPIVSGYSGSVAVVAGASLVVAARNRGSSAGTVVGQLKGGSGSTYHGAYLTAVDAGGTLLDSSVAPARAVVMGWMLTGTDDFTAAGKVIIGQAVDWLVPAATMSGTVMAVSGVSGSLAPAMLAGTVQAISGLSGVLSPEPTLSGTVMALSSVSGELSPVLLAGTVAIVSGVEGLLGVIPLAGTVEATSGVEGMLSPGPTIVGIPTLSGISSFVASRGSLWLPYVITGASGSKSLDFSVVPTSPLTTKPDALTGHVASRSLWCTLEVTASSVVTFDLTGLVGQVEVFVDDDGVDPALQAILADGRPVDVPASAGDLLLVRAHPTSSSETGVGTLTWSSVARPPEGTLVFWAAGTLAETPGWLPVTVTSASPEAILTFTIDALPEFFLAGTDEGGTFRGEVWIPLLAAGTLTISVLDGGNTQTGSDTFVVETDDPGPVTPPITITPPVLAPTTRWVFTNAGPGGETYTVPINPSSMSTPHVARPVTADHTLYAGGTKILWEGNPEPVVWQVEGSMRTSAHYEAMTRFYALQRRFWISDHLNRLWLVTFESFEVTELKEPDAFNYTAKFLIVGDVT